MHNVVLKMAAVSNNMNFFMAFKFNVFGEGIFPYSDIVTEEKEFRLMGV